jgi:dihydroorotase
VADAGSSGYKNFEDFKENILDRSKTGVLAFLNIVYAGMRGPRFENNLADMDPQPAAAMAKKYPGLIIGIKTAHYAGPDGRPLRMPLRAGTEANIPVCSISAPTGRSVLSLF